MPEFCRVPARSPADAAPADARGILAAADRASAQALDNLLLTDIATAQEIAGTPGRINRIDLILPPGHDTAALVASLPDGATLTTPNAANSAIMG